MLSLESSAVAVSLPGPRSGVLGGMHIGGQKSQAGGGLFKASRAGSQGATALQRESEHWAPGLAAEGWWVLSSLLPASGLCSLSCPVPPPHRGSRMSCLSCRPDPARDRIHSCHRAPFPCSSQGELRVSRDPLPVQPHHPAHAPAPATLSHLHAFARSVPSAQQALLPPQLAKSSFQSSSKLGGRWHLRPSSLHLKGSKGVLLSAWITHPLHACFCDRPLNRLRVTLGPRYGPHPNPPRNHRGWH